MTSTGHNLVLKHSVPTKKAVGLCDPRLKCLRGGWGSTSPSTHRPAILLQFLEQISPCLPCGKEAPSGLRCSLLGEHWPGLLRPWVPSPHCKKKKNPSKMIFERQIFLPYPYPRRPDLQSRSLVKEFGILAALPSYIKTPQHRQVLPQPFFSSPFSLLAGISSAGQVATWHLLAMW